MGRVGRRRGRNDGKNRHGLCNYCRNPTEHGWNDRPFRLSHQQTGETHHANATQVIFHSGIYLTRMVHDYRKRRFGESFQVVIGDGAERPPSDDEMYL